MINAILIFLAKMLISYFLKTQFELSNELKVNVERTETLQQQLIEQRRINMQYDKDILAVKKVTEELAGELQSIHDKYLNDRKEYERLQKEIDDRVISDSDAVRGEL